MEDKKIPYGVFVLQYFENMIKDYATAKRDEYEVLYEFVQECELCPLRTQGLCKGYMSLDGCKNLLRYYVEKP